MLRDADMGEGITKNGKRKGGTFIWLCRLFRNSLYIVTVAFNFLQWNF